MRSRVIIEILVKMIIKIDLRKDLRNLTCDVERLLDIYRDSGLILPIAGSIVAPHLILDLTPLTTPFVRITVVDASIFSRAERNL